MICVSAQQSGRPNWPVAGVLWEKYCTEGAYSTWLPYSSAVTRSWQKCGRRLGPSWACMLFMHSTTAEDSTGLAEKLLANRKARLRDAEADAAVATAP